MPRDPWDDVPSGDFFQFENPGDMLVGDVIGKTLGKDFNGNPCPEMQVRQDDGTEVTATCGQAQLKAKLLEAKPQVGDRISITFTNTQRRDGGKTLKEFEVKVKTGGAKSKVSEPAPPPADDDDF